MRMLICGRSGACRNDAVRDCRRTRNIGRGQGSPGPFRLRVRQRTRQWIPATATAGAGTSPLNHKHLSRDQTGLACAGGAQRGGVGLPRCGGASRRVAAYNRLLRRHRRTFAAADAARERASIASRHGAEPGRREHDRAHDAGLQFLRRSPSRIDGFLPWSRDILARAEADKPGRLRLSSSRPSQAAAAPARGALHRPSTATMTRGAADLALRGQWASSPAPKPYA